MAISEVEAKKAVPFCSAVHHLRIDDAVVALTIASKSSGRGRRFIRMFEALPACGPTSTASIIAEPRRPSKNITRSVDRANPVMLCSLQPSTRPADVPANLRRVARQDCGLLYRLRNGRWEIDGRAASRHGARARGQSRATDSPRATRRCSPRLRPRSHTFRRRGEGAARSRRCRLRRSARSA